MKRREFNIGFVGYIEPPSGFVTLIQKRTTFKESMFYRIVFATQNTNSTISYPKACQFLVSD